MSFLKKGLLNILTMVEILTGLQWYLKYCGSCVSWEKTGVGKGARGGLLEESRISPCQLESIYGLS